MAKLPPSTTAGNNKVSTSSPLQHHQIGLHQPQTVRQPPIPQCLTPYRRPHLPLFVREYLTPRASPHNSPSSFTEGLVYILFGPSADNSLLQLLTTTSGDTASHTNSFFGILRIFCFLSHRSMLVTLTVVWTVGCGDYLGTLRTVRSDGWIGPVSPPDNNHVRERF